MNQPSRAAQESRMAAFKNHIGNLEPPLLSALWSASPTTHIPGKVKRRMRSK